MELCFYGFHIFSINNILLINCLLIEFYPLFGCKENRLEKMGKKMWFSMFWIAKENRKERKVDRKLTLALPKFIFKHGEKLGEKQPFTQFVNMNFVKMHDLIIKLPLSCAN